MSSDRTKRRLVMIDQFKADIKTLSAPEIYQRYVLTGSCAAINDNDAYSVRRAISTKYDVDYNNVIIVGSANLGFSIKPSKRYVQFGDESDIDIAIVCPKLFEKVWREIFIYERSGAVWPEKSGYRKYLAKGWIRPDLLPPSNVFSFSNEWFEYFRAIPKDRLPYKVTGGIYYSSFFLEQYQTICIEECKAEE